EVRLGSRGEGRRLLVPHVDPSKLVLSTDRVRDPVKRVSREPIDPRDPPADDGLHKQLRDALFSHGVSSLPFDPRPAARRARPRISANAGKAPARAGPSGLTRLWSGVRGRGSGGRAAAPRP